MTETERDIVRDMERKRERVRGGGGGCLLVGCLTPQQQSSVSQGRICTILRAATLR